MPREAHDSRHAAQRRHELPEIRAEGVETRIGHQGRTVVVGASGPMRPVAEQTGKSRLRLFENPSRHRRARVHPVGDLRGVAELNPAARPR